MQIVAERLTEPIVTIGKGLCFTCEGIASPFIPLDQRIPDMQHGHADTATAAFLREILCGGQQGASQLSVLQIRADGEKAEIPGTVLSGI